MNAQAVKDELDEAGEIIVFTDAGEEFELHLDDVEYENDVFKWDAGDKRWVLDADSIESILVHASHKM